MKNSYPDPIFLLTLFFILLFCAISLAHHIGFF